MPSLAVPCWTLAAAALVGVPAYAWRVRGRSYATFVLVVLAVARPGACATHVRLRALAGPDAAPWLDLAFLYATAAAAAHLTALVRPRLRRAPFRHAVSIPGMAFVAGGALASVW